MQLQVSQRKAYKDHLRGALEKVKPRIINLELNRGCSNGCWFCCFSAKKGADRPIPFDLIEDTKEVISTYPNNPLAIVPHSRSDPLDYRTDGKTAIDVYHTMRGAGNRLEVRILTAVPIGSEDILLAMIGQEINFSLTFSQVNEERLLRIPEIAKELEAYQLTKKTIPVSFAIVDQNTIRRMKQDRGRAFETIGENIITSDELGLDRKFHDLIKVFMAKFVSKPEIMINPFDRAHLVPIIGSFNGAVIYGQPIDDMERLPLVNDIAQFSALVNSGRLRAGEPFLIRFWQFSGSGWVSGMKFTPVFRDWELTNSGRVFQRNFEYEYNAGCGPTVPTILITSDGAIHSMHSIRPREENKEGLVIEQISGPVY